MTSSCLIRCYLCNFFLSVTLSAHVSTDHENLCFNRLIFIKLKRRSGRQGVQFYIWPKFAIYIVNNSRKFSRLFIPAGGRLCLHDFWFDFHHSTLSSTAEISSRSANLFCPCLLFVGKLNTIFMSINSIYAMLSHHHHHHWPIKS